MTISAGTRLGLYEITTLLGVGGMGEVYGARDTKLGRAVAIKVLPEALAFDPERVARFEREAKVLASLNHPHIAALHGMEQSAGQHFLIMELVEGETLAERLRRGALPVEEALRLAIQMADALEAAHEKGVVHRDLKPANVKITPSEQVKVLDFGLARAMESAPAAASLTNSPTLSFAATQAGVILGTAAYMSPEQANGLPADHRSDVFSFGCVLYELLTGKQAFQGSTGPEILASVLVREPDLAALPPNLNPRLTDALRRCLEKQPKRRWQAIGDLRVELEAIAAAPHTTPAAAPVVVRRGPLWRRLALFSAPALLAGAAAAGGAVWFATRPPTPAVTRLAITAPPAAAPSVSGISLNVALTPDGSRVVYVSANGSLFVRPLDALDPIPVHQGAPQGPVVSPDGQWVAFGDRANTLKKVAISGGPTLTVANVDGPLRSAAWMDDDTMVFATAATATGLQRVPAAGGTPTVLTRPDRDKGELDHYWPEALPGNRGVLFTITSSRGPDAAQVAVLDLQTGEQKILIRGGSHAHYLPSGHLVYAAAGSLRAVPFDLDRLETYGTAVPVVAEIATTAQGGAQLAVARGGTLVYFSGAAGGERRTVVWVDRQGQETALDPPPRPYLYPRLSPDGSRVSFFLLDEERDVWIWDLARRTLTRATFDPNLDGQNAWTPDGRRLIFSSERDGPRNIYAQAADGTGSVERLTETPNLQNVTSVTPDGTHVIFGEQMPKTGTDIMQLALDGSRRVTPLVQTPFTEQNGIVSPDGRWLAYEANDSGRFDIYVRPYPDVATGKWQVSTGGGTRPLWSRDGRELFYLSLSGAVMGVRVERGTAWAATGPSVVVKDGYYVPPPNNLGRTYDISPDGKRFLMVKEGGGPEQSTMPPQIIVVQNFIEELKARVPMR